MKSLGIVERKHPFLETLMPVSSRKTKVERKHFYLFRTSTFWPKCYTCKWQILERNAERISKERLGRIFSWHVKAESRESFLKIRQKWLESIWRIHLFITFTRIIWQKISGWRWWRLLQESAEIWCCPKMRFFLPSCLTSAKTRKDHFQQHQMGLADVQLLIFEGGGHEDADIWKMTVPCSSF